MDKTIKITFIVLAMAFIFLVGMAQAATYYVSQSGTGDGLSDGSPESIADFNSGTGTGNIFATLDNDTVYIMGQIITPIVIPDGGTSGNIVTIRGDDVGNECTVHVTADGTAMTISVDYVLVDGFIFDSSCTDCGFSNGRQIDITNGTDYVEIKNCTFTGGGAHEDAPAVAVHGDYHYIHDNTFGIMAEAVNEGTESDSLWLYGASYARIIDNTFSEGGGHFFIFIRSSSNYNVVRNNTGTISDHWDGNDNKSLDGVYSVGDTGVGNLAELNTWTTTSLTSDTRAGVQFTSGVNSSIYRKNTHNRMPGNIYVYAKSAINEYNFIYNNTFYDVSEWGEGFVCIQYSEGTFDTRYNQFVNNIVYKYDQDVQSAAYEVAVHTYNSAYVLNNYFRNNAMYDSSYTDGYVRLQSVSQTITTAEAASQPVNGVYISGSVLTQPTFVTLGSDFAPLNGSSVQVDAGTYLTLANGAAPGGSSATLTVDIGGAYAFWDGNGITGETADYIYIVGDGDPANVLVQISSVDSSTQITLASAQNWQDNAEIYLAYSSTVGLQGTAPDIGAEESTGLAATIRGVSIK